MPYAAIPVLPITTDVYPLKFMLISQIIYLKEAKGQLLYLSKQVHV